MLTVQLGVLQRDLLVANVRRLEIRGLKVVAYADDVIILVSGKFLSTF